MQFAVPQFTDVEDRLIGPLTLKQFLILLGTGGVVLFFWSIFGISLLFFLISLPFSLLGIAMAFGTFNSRPLISYGGAFISFVTRPQVRIFKREEPVMMIKVEPKKIENAPAAQESPESRLKKLAYLLDQKVHEEDELIKRF